MLKFAIIAFGLILYMLRDVHAGEKSLYDFLWLDPDKKVYVLQNKLYKKEQTFYADVGYLSNLTSKFQDTRGFQLKTGYYFHEEWGVELFYNQYSNSNNDEYRNIQSVSGVEPFIRKVNSTYGALLVWSPFYGKINTFNKIFYFDWSFGAGLGKVNSSSNVNTVGAGAGVPVTFQNESYNAGILKTNVKFHLKENIHLGIEYMSTNYEAAGPKNPKQKELRMNSDLILSIGFSY
jgi:outer membrane beta-barrel protein